MLVLEKIVQSLRCIYAVQAAVLLHFNGLRYTVFTNHCSSPNTLHSLNLREDNQTTSIEITFMKLVGALGQSTGVHM